MGTQKHGNLLRNVWITGQVVWTPTHFFVRLGDFEWLYLVYHNNDKNL